MYGSVGCFSLQIGKGKSEEFQLYHELPIVAIDVMKRFVAVKMDVLAIEHSELLSVL